MTDCTITITLPERQADMLREIALDTLEDSARLRMIEKYIKAQLDDASWYMSVEPICQMLGIRRPEKKEEDKA